MSEERANADSLDCLVRCLIADMAVALRDFEQSAWDGDPCRRSDDELCMRACRLIDRANEIVEANREIDRNDPPNICPD